MAILQNRMRRVALICLCLAALAAPAAALAAQASPGDGTLVVKNGSAPSGVAVVTLVIQGTAIGRVVTGSPDVTDAVVVEDLTGSSTVTVNPVAGAVFGTKKLSDTKTRYVGSDLRFRVVGDDAFKITIYGSGVNLFAVGHGRVTLQGSPDVSVKDGQYSLNGQDFKSLPAAPTAWLPISAPVIG